MCLWKQESLADCYVWGNGNFNGSFKMISDSLEWAAIFTWCQSVKWSIHVYASLLYLSFLSDYQILLAYFISLSLPRHPSPTTGPYSHPSTLSTFTSPMFYLLPYLATANPTGIMAMIRTRRSRRTNINWVSAPLNIPLLLGSIFFIKLNCIDIDLVDTGEWTS